MFHQIGFIITCRVKTVNLRIPYFFNIDWILFREFQGKMEIELFTYHRFIIPLTLKMDKR